VNSEAPRTMPISCANVIISNLFADETVVFPFALSQTARIRAFEMFHSEQYRPIAITSPLGLSSIGNGEFRPNGVLRFFGSSPTRPLR
jgi:hypothetical protein